MSFYKVLIKKCRLYHYSTSFSVRVVQNQQCTFSLPSDIATADHLLGIDTIKDLSGLYNDPFKAFYYKNSYDECFILMHCRQYLIVVGPILTAPILEGELNTIIMNNKLSIKHKTNFSKYYNSLPLIDQNRYYYSGKLLEQLIHPTNLITIDDDSEEEETFIPDEYFINTVENRQSMFHHPPYFLEQELVNKIKEGNIKQAKSILNEINRLKRAKLTDNPIRSIKNSLICSTTIFTRAIIEGGVDPESAFTLSDTFIHNIEKSNDVAHLIQMEYKIVEDMISAKNNMSSNKYSPPIQRALTYIHDHLTEKITLDRVANFIYVHPNYLSSLFIKEVGSSFKEYINKKRIEEAKYYIRYTTTPLSDVATFFHFCNQSYFTQQFKKYTSLTPNQYRTKYMK
ncbi:AraC family transcriptional regulator [Vallitalea okinawensis]|uniref:AraC family transcriptional regulator n=1 Tax=Vallitalea okinawensis TaxID=2078660 RepID=UPI000CFB9023|nr:AraC family transcriptional regulator [Vallitalea okinawensis]